MCSHRGFERASILKKQFIFLDSTFENNMEFLESTLMVNWTLFELDLGSSIKLPLL